VNNCGYDVETVEFEAIPPRLAPSSP